MLGYSRSVSRMRTGMGMVHFQRHSDSTGAVHVNPQEKRVYSVPWWQVCLNVRFTFVFIFSCWRANRQFDRIPAKWHGANRCLSASQRCDEFHFRFLVSSQHGATTVLRRNRKDFLPLYLNALIPITVHWSPPGLLASQITNLRTLKSSFEPREYRQDLLGTVGLTTTLTLTGNHWDWLKTLLAQANKQW